jgi:hypothetical protein
VAPAATAFLDLKEREVSMVWMDAQDKMGNLAGLVHKEIKETGDLTVYQVSEAQQENLYVLNCKL